MTKAKLTLFFDGGCPLCLREVKFLRSRDTLKNISFVDIDSSDYEPDFYSGISYKDAMGRIHAINESVKCFVLFHSDQFFGFLYDVIVS